MKRKTEHSSVLYKIYILTMKHFKHSSL